MKTIDSIAALTLILTPEMCAQAGAKPVMRDAATHQELSLAMRKAGQVNPMSRMTPANGPDPSTVHQPKDLLATSDILCFGGLATLVPKQAVMCVPKNLAERLKFQAGSRILTWAEFYSLNRGWITTVEVSRVQAEGNSPIAEEIATRIGKSSNLVVAVYKGGPISVLPPKLPVPEANESQPPTGKAKS